MCGIVGYIGKNQAKDVLLEGLRRLEYRGYDSAGVAVANKGKASVVKAVGKVAALEEKTANRKLLGTVGIAHTRWATHGGVTVANAHPHQGNNGIVHLVHNGIIENFAELKEQLKKQGSVFRTETDSEVIAHLIEREHEKKDLQSAVCAAIKKLRGAYGLVVISTKEPDTVVAVRNSSPLVLGVGDDEFIFASDPSAIVSHTRKVVYLNDGEIAVVSGDSYRVLSFAQEEKNRKAVTLEWDTAEAKKGGYPHFTLKEIMEQPEALADTMRGRVRGDAGKVRLGGLTDVMDRIQEIDNIVIVSMGTAYYAGRVAAAMFEEYAGIPTTVEYSSEFMYHTSFANEKTMVIAISQSGETAETLGAVREAKRKRALTIGIVNAAGSTIARETDAGVYNHAGPEIGVASTKAFTSQLTVLTLMVILLGRQRKMSRVTEERITKELVKIPRLVEQILKDHDAIKKIAKKYAKYDHLFCLGRKYQQPIAFEAALKIKELTYLHAEGQSTGLLKHGSIALIDKNFPSLFFAPKDSVYEKNVSSIQEVKARGGKIIAVTTKGNKELDDIADDVITVPKTLELLTPILTVIPVQLIAYHIAVARKLDVDKPRNLAKSVTVE